ncbi:MAG: hypothetical protein ABL901_14640 [Hyphomicrobiaceae bacterium]
MGGVIAIGQWSVTPQEKQDKYFWVLPALFVFSPAFLVLIPVFKTVAYMVLDLLPLWISGPFVLAAMLLFLYVFLVARWVLLFWFGYWLEQAFTLAIRHARLFVWLK